MKIFRNEATDSTSREGTLPIKQEVLYTKKRSYGEEKLYSVKSGESKKESTNPIDKEGKIMRCHECDSKMHFASKCPHRQKGKGNQSDQQNACEVI